MKKTLIAASLLSCLTALPALPQGPPFATDLHLPSKITFTKHHNLVVAESGTPANNTGRVSIIDRATGERRTLLEGLPSGISRAEEPGSPSGPSGVAVQDRTVYVTIGVGDAVLPGPVAGSEQANPTPASPILASLLALVSSEPLDTARGGFVLTPSQHAVLKGGATVTLTNDEGESLDVRLVADFPDHTAEARPDFAENVRAGNPFGVVAQGQTLFVVDASQNVVRRVDANTGSTTTLATIGKISNPLPFGPPVIDPVPDSIHLHGSDLMVTTLTGFPFPAGKASVLHVGTAGGSVMPVVTGLSTAIDSAALGDGPGDPLLVLEFSTNMLEGAPGRLLLVTPGGETTTIAEGLPTPTSMAVDRTTGEVFVTHIFPGLVTRIDAHAQLPSAPPTAVIPAVVSAPGAYDAQFQTRMQLANPFAFPISGKIVVHPAGMPASSGDPSVSYSLGAFQSTQIDTLIAEGGGSADVLAAAGPAPAIVTTIVETESMNRLQMPAVAPEDAISAGERATLLVPVDPTRERFNVGIRSLGSGANLTMRVYDANGTLVTSLTRAFPANYFQQFSFRELLGIDPAAGESLSIEVLAGAAIVYGSGVDNETGTMSLQLPAGMMD
jgi:hypothetical protein